MYITHSNILRSCQVIFVPLRPFSYEAGDRIAIRTNHLQLFFSTVRIDKPCHLITGFTDYPIELFFHTGEFVQIIEDPMILSWSAMNTTLSHPKLTHLEYGLYDHVIDYYVKNADRLKKIPKKDDVFYSFSIEWNRPERESLPNSKRIPLDDYANTMASYRYVYCPMGLGMDCSKVYEAIACGCIPIVKVPTAFAETYRRFNFVCVPGTCNVLVGILDAPDFVYKYTSPYIPETTIDNSLELCTFDGQLYHAAAYLNTDVFPHWKHYNDNVLRHGFQGLRLVQK